MTSPAYVSNFAGAAGTPLTSLPGWSLSRTGSGAIDAPVLSGAGTLTGPTLANPGAEGTWAVLHDEVGPLGGSRVTFTLRAPQTDNFKRTRIFAAALDYANGIGLAPNCRLPTDQPGDLPVDVGNFFLKQNNVVSSISLPVYGYHRYKIDRTIDFVFDFNASGTSLTLTIVGAATVSGSIDIASYVKGTRFGFTGTGPFAAAIEEGTFVQAVRYLKPNVNLAVTKAPVFSANNTGAYELSWSGEKPEGLACQFYDEDGNPVGAWTTVAATITGTTSGTITCIATAPIGAPLIAHFRPTNDIAVEIEAPKLTYFSANVQPFTLGGNVRGDSYFSPIGWQNDFGPASTAQDDRIYMPFDGIEGFSTITFTGGSAITGSSSDVQIISNNYPVVRVNITPNGGDRTRFFSFAGALPTSMHAVRDGLANDITPELLAATAELTVIRDLDAEAVNQVPLNGSFVRNTPATPFWKNNIGTGPDIPYQVKTRAFATKLNTQPNFTGPWFVIAADIPLEPDGSTQSIRERAIFWRDNMPARAKIKIEAFNEYPWNNFTGTQRGVLDSLRLNYDAATTPSSPRTPKTIVDVGGQRPGTEPPGTRGQGDPGSLATPVDIPSGGYIYANIYSIGEAVYRAKQFAPAGTFVADGTVDAQGNVTSVSENAFFTKLTINAAQSARRYQMARLKAIDAILLDVFGAARHASQIELVLMGQNGGSIYDQFADHRAFDPETFAKIQYVGAAFYIGPEGPLNPATCTAAQIEAAFRAEMPIALGYVKQTVLDALRMGKKVALYEGGSHPPDGFYRGEPNHPNYNFFVQWNLFFNSDAGKQFMSDWMFLIKSNVPGLAVFYDWLGAMPWSVMNSTSDTSNKRLLGLRDGLARAGDIVPPVEPPIDPPVDPPVDPPIDPPVEPPVEPPVALPNGCLAFVLAFR